MRRYFKFLTTSLIACVLTIACVNELDLHQPINESEFYTALVPRVEGFANQYITKSSYETSEQKITKIAILVFNEDGKCIHLQESENGGPITLNKSMLNSPEQSGKLDQATVVMIANIGADKIVNGEKTIKNNWSSLTFSDLENYSFQYDDAQTIITSLGDGFIGFPMIGASKVDLTSKQAAIEVKLKILYAKIKFAISVENGTENEGSGMSFQLSNYSVFNASKQTKLAVPTNQGEPTMSFEEFLLGQQASESPQPATESSATESDSYAYKNPDPDNQDNQGSAAGRVSVSVGENPISFTFYVSESRFNHNLDLNGLAGIYPEGWTTSDLKEDVKEGSDDKPNGVKYFYDDLVQQYKPKLAQSASGMPGPGQGLATYVLLNGLYTDYRGESWNVNYKVYLGKDNSQNFQVDRNSCYTNNIVIKGIRNNNDTDGRGEVWIDHRVDVEIGDANSAADHITITRETLIDSHIEVRPLRVSWPEGEYAFARVYLPFYQDNGTTWSQRDEKTSQKKNWIGIELGDKTGSLYCSGDTNPAKGKRKYFTDALVSELNLSSENRDIVSEDVQNKFIPLENNQCAWIYIDEYFNDESTATNPATADRKAKIVVDFCKIDNNEIKVLSSEEYILYQQPLINIGQGKYYVENYEEYLHSYDSYDNYNISSTPADYTRQGLPWGYFYTDKTKNHLSKSQFVTKKPLDEWTDWTPTNNEAYDFVHSVDANSLIQSGYRIADKEGKDIDLSKNNGYNFTYSVSANNAVSISSMDEMPESAYQYCLSKNKFKEGTNGQDNEMLIHWYVPDVYELSDIFASTESPLSDENYYWSSQVPYNLVTSGVLQTNIASEDIENARLVSKNGEITDNDLRKRSKKHRIRCLYNRDGKTADMDGRTPEGIGGLMIIPMKVENNGFFDYEPWITDVTGGTTDYPDPLPTYRFPMGDTYEGGANDPNRQEADEDFGGVIVDGTHYYTKNPLDPNNWGPLGSGENTTYEAMNPKKWPGLSNKEAELWQDSQFINRYKLTDKDKQITRTYTKRSGAKIESLPSNVTDIYLDHNEHDENDSGNLKISFGQGTNSSNTPSYEYYYEDPKAAKGRTWVRKWEVPEYTGKGNKIVDCSKGPIEYDQEDVKKKIQDEYYQDRKLKRKLIEGEPVYNTDPSVYRYKSKDEAISAALDYFNTVINKNGDYIYREEYTFPWGNEVVSPKITVTGSEVLICTYDWKGQTRGWTKWEDNGESGKNAEYKETRYTWSMECESPYQYVKGTGGWGKENETTDGEQSMEPAKANVDALTFYAGNTFTITADPGYYIRSVKVNFNNSTIESGKTYLRLVDNSKDLPDTNKEPEQMTYLDGTNGWSKWTSVSNDISVTLRLVICDMNTNSWWYENWGDPKMTHKDPSTSEQRNQSLIIESLEIRLEKVEETNN